MWFKNNVDIKSRVKTRRVFVTSSLRDFAIDRLKSNLRLREVPVFSCSHLFALFPFKQKDEQLEFNGLSLIYSFALSTVFVIYSFLHTKKVQETEQSNYNILLYTSYTLVNIVFAIACIVTPILSKNSITSILRNFAKIDALISSLEYDYEFRDNHKRQSIQICFTFGITLLFILFYEAASRENIFPSFTYLEFYIVLVNWLIIFQLDYLLVNLQKRFTFVNSQLEALIKESENAIENGATNGTATFPHLNKLNCIHFTLYKISTEINDTYSVQLLIMVPRLIFFSVLPLHYNIVSALVSDPKNNPRLNIWSHIFTLNYIALLSAPLMYVVNKASDTVNQAKRVNTLIHDLIDEDQEERVEYELLVFSMQLLHRKIEFSVKHFFSLKPSLTTTILELIITYVIIILQFQDTLSSASPIRLLLRPLQQSYHFLTNVSAVTPSFETWVSTTNNVYEENKTISTN